MYCVRMTTEQDGIYESEVVIKTQDKHQAELAFEGTVLGVKYNKKGTEEIEDNKYVLHGTNDKVIVTLKEEQHEKGKRNKNRIRHNKERSDSNRYRTRRDTNRSSSKNSR